MDTGPVVEIIAAHDRNRLIGANGGLPWQLPEQTCLWLEVSFSVKKI